MISHGGRRGTIRPPSLLAILQVSPTPALPLLAQRRIHRGRSALLRTLHVIPRGIQRGRQLTRHMHLQPRHDPPGHHAQPVQPPRPIAPLNLVGHLDIRRLALTVGGPGLVAALGEIVVVEADAGGAVAGRGEADDAGGESRGRRTRGGRV